MDTEQHGSNDSPHSSGGWSEETKTRQDILLAALGDANAVRQYQDEMEFFADALTQLHVNIYVLERIFEFPIPLFLNGTPEDAIFLSQTVNSLLDASALLITRLVVDRKNDTHSLRVFHQWLIQTVTPEFQQELQRRLGTVDFRRRDDPLLTRLRNVRDRQIAHTLNDYYHEVVSAQTPAIHVRFDELKQLRDELSAYLNALAFDADYTFLPLGYDPGHSDIDRLLDMVARNSPLLNLPERQPDFWRARRSQLTSAQLAQINSYRRKFGLSEA